jgi:membrane glycosyltransferase
MDGLTSFPGGAAAPMIEPRPTPGMPQESRVDMPEQRLGRFDAASRRRFLDPYRSQSRKWPRIAVLGGAAAISAFAVDQMTVALAVGGLTPIEAMVLVLFAVNFAWIAITFTTAIAGFFLLSRPSPPAGTGPIAGRTAVLMPSYNENPERVFAAIEAMASGIERLGHNASFDWFVLSDTTDPAMAIAEETALHEWRARLAESVRVYYRRRRRNVGRKAGNIGDFCRRWGGAYDYLLMLDADSLVEPETILALVRRMEADPDAGLIQTIPRLVNGRTIFARLQQFASRVYGPVIGSGLAWLSGSEGNYWGHNAIVRREAFTKAAGLPHLSGKPPFGGHILSHDFVEAALIRRAGWTVKIAHDLGGSYEESPPSLIDLAVRDSRWCQGNLQHTRIVAARGLHWMSRFHLVVGILSYLASLWWLFLILSGLALALQAQFIRPEYFKELYQLFPTWPAIDPDLELRLLGLTGLVLFGPKLLGLVVMLRDGPARRAAGGRRKIVASFLCELVASVLIAPIMMVMQSSVILAILMGRDSGWKPQRRDGGSLGFGEIFRVHRWHMASGVALAAAAYAVSPTMLAWLSPAIAGLLFAAPISALTGSLAAGDWMERHGLLRTPEEHEKPAIGRVAHSCRTVHRAVVETTPDLGRLVRDDKRRRAHLALVEGSHERPRGQVDPVEAVAAFKIAEARTLDEAIAYLGPEEQAFALATPSLFERLGALREDRPAA